MKKIILMFILCISTLTMNAQQKNHNFNERLFNAKLAEIVYRLNITDEQKTKFEPIYRRYNEEMIAAWGERRQPQKPNTSEESAQLTKRRMERQQRAQAVRLKYVDEFAKVLDAKQMNRFFDVESDIQARLKARKGNHHPQTQQRQHKHMKK